MGALVSWLFLGLLLPAYQPLVGMPPEVLRGLALLALALCFYSLSRALFADLASPHWLGLVIGANLSYCFLSATLLVLFWSLLEPLGIAYFLAEKFVVLGLVAIEVKVYRACYGGRR